MALRERMRMRTRCAANKRRMQRTSLAGCGIGRLPGDFDVVGNALRVVTPLEFVDV